MKNYVRGGHYDGTKVIDDSNIIPDSYFSWSPTDSELDLLSMFVYYVKEKSKVDILKNVNKITKSKVFKAWIDSRKSSFDFIPYSPDGAVDNIQDHSRLEVGFLITYELGDFIIYSSPRTTYFVGYESKKKYKNISPKGCATFFKRAKTPLSWDNTGGRALTFIDKFLETNKKFVPTLKKLYSKD